MPGARTGTANGGPDVPATGSRVSLMPTSVPVRVAVGTVRDWVRSPSGLVVTARVRVPPADAEALDGLPVWLSARTSGADCLVVLSALASRRPSGQLSVTGVADLVLETRRAGPRARLQAGVTLRLPDAPVPDRLWAGTLVDLSRHGCRVRTDVRLDVAVPDRVRLDLRLRDGRLLRAAGRVLRTDGALCELVVAFDDLSQVDLGRLDFEVLSALDAPVPA